MLIKNRGSMCGRSVEIGAEGGKLVGGSSVGAGGDWGGRVVVEGNYGVSEKSEEGEGSEIVGDVWVSGSGHGVCGVWKMGVVWEIWRWRGKYLCNVKEKQKETEVL